MSRTISIREIRKASDEELKSISKMSRKEIFLSFETIFSLFEEEMEDELYKPMKGFMQPVETLDNKKLYVAICTFMKTCSDDLLGVGVISKIPDYKAGTYADITFLLAGETIDVKRVTWDKEGNEVERKVRFSFPPLKEGSHIFYFDDMD